MIYIPFFNKVLLGKEMNSKYIGDSSLDGWTKMETNSIKGASKVWKFLVNGKLQTIWPINIVYSFHEYF